MTTGEKIRCRRRELKMSMDKLSETAGIAKVTIYRIEKNIVKKFHPSTLKLIAEALGTKAIELLGDDNA